MKKTLTMVLTLALVLALAACGGGASSGEAEAFVSGTVADASMNTLLLQTEDGNEYLFGTEDVPVQGEGILLGAAVTVYYTGTLQAGSTSMQAVQVKSISVTAVPESLPAVAAPGPESPISGTIVDASMHVISVQAQDGNIYIFALTDDTIINSQNGILLGDEAAVYFEGEINMEALGDVQPVSVGTVDITSSAGQRMPAQEPHHTQVPPQNPNPATDYMSGTVVDASMSVIVIQSIYGYQYTFNTNDSTQYTGVGDGLALGQTVGIYFVGALNNNTADVQDVTVTEVKLIGGAQSMGTNTVESTPAGDVKVITGTIDIVNGDSIMMSDATGVDYLLPLAGADIQSGSVGLQEGDAVTVYYIGDLVGSPELQNVTVTQVQVHH